MASYEEYTAGRPEEKYDQYVRRVSVRNEASRAGEPSAPELLGRGALRRGGELIDFAADVIPGAQPLAGVGESFIEQNVPVDPSLSQQAQNIEAAGGALLESVPFAPMAGAGAAKLGINPVLGALFEMGAATVGGYTQAGLAEQGMPIAGMGAGIALGGAAPGAAAAATKIGRAAPRLAANVGDLMTPEAGALAKQLQVSPKALVRGSEELKRRVPNVPRFIQALRDAGRRRSFELPESLSSRQVADAMPFQEGGPHFSAMEESISRNDIEFGTQAARRRAANQRYLAEKWNELGGGEETADYVNFLQQYDDGSTIARANERAAWSRVREGEQPTFSTQLVRDEMDRVTQSLNLSDDLDAIPRVFEDLFDSTKFSEEMSLNDFQDVRSNLLEIIRESKAAPTRANKTAARIAAPVLERMEGMMDAWAEGDDVVGEIFGVVPKSAEYAAARALTRANKDLYDPNSPVIRALESGGDQKGLFRSIRSGRGKRGARTTPQEEAERVVRIAEQVPGGRENLVKMAIEDLFGEGLDFAATRTSVPIKTLQNNEAVYRTVLGNEQYEKAIDLLELSRMAVRGKAGTAAQAMSVGSGVAPAAFLFGLAEEALSPVPGTRTAQNMIRTFIDSLGPTERALMQDRITREALENPESMRVLMEMPTEATLPAWVVNWRQLVAKSRDAGARATARAESARRRQEGAR
jgi:hypothetical protein